MDIKKTTKLINQRDWRGNISEAPNTKVEDPIAMSSEESIKGET